MPAEQIPLQLGHYEPFKLDQFIEADNSHVIKSITELVETESSTKPLYLWGKKTTGKSHLLQAACDLANQKHLSVAYVPLELIIDHSPETLEGLEQQDLICIDDIQIIGNQSDWQLAIFNLYNRIHELSKKLIVSANESPLNINIELADLKSRLSWGNTIYVEELNDLQKIQLLKQKANLRSFDLPNEIAEYLLTRVERDLNSLLTILDKIDQHSLAQQRKITIPFIKTLLE